MTSVSCHIHFGISAKIFLVKSILFLLFFSSTHLQSFDFTVFQCRLELAVLPLKVLNLPLQIHGKDCRDGVVCLSFSTIKLLQNCKCSNRSKDPRRREEKSKKRKEKKKKFFFASSSSFSSFKTFKISSDFHDVVNCKEKVFIARNSAFC